MKGGHASLVPGTLIADQFRLKSEIGAGGNGAVWEADHLRLGSLVAIKFMNPGSMDIEGEKQRFANEARLASRLRSPHVVQVFDHGTTEDGIPYLVMERLEGSDLATYVDYVGRCSLVETALILEQIGRALTRAHAQGLVHRDIKPSNVFLTPQGDGYPFVKLLDFGIAKDMAMKVGSITLSGVVLGSAHYASPEQLRDASAVGPAADIWALGVVCYEMLTGVVPFHGDSLPEVLMRVERSEFLPASHLRPELPAEIDAWFRCAIHHDPAARFATAEDMTRALADIVRAHVQDVPASMAFAATPRAPGYEPAPDAARADAGGAPYGRAGVGGALYVRARARLGKVTWWQATSWAAAVGGIAFGAVLALRLFLSAQAPSAPAVPPANASGVSAQAVVHEVPPASAQARAEAPAVAPDSPAPAPALEAIDAAPAPDVAGPPRPRAKSKPQLRAAARETPSQSQARAKKSKPTKPADAAAKLETNGARAPDKSPATYRGF